MRTCVHAHACTWASHLWLLFSLPFRSPVFPDMCARARLFVHVHGTGMAGILDVRSSFSPLFVCLFSLYAHPACMCCRGRGRGRQRELGSRIAEKTT